MNPSDKKKAYNADGADKMSILYQFASQPATKLGDLQLTGAQLAAMDSVLPDSASNSTGITTLGSMYALAAGFYSSEYYTGGDAGKPSNYGEFGAVISAMSNSEFEKYYANQAEADLEA